MKTIGLIGGMSWESTVPYYRIINETVKQALGGLHSAKIALYSVEFDEIERCQSEGRWDDAAKILADFDGYAKDFRKIVPNDYKEMLEEINKQRQQGLEYDEAVLKAFGEVTSRG